MFLEFLGDETDGEVTDQSSEEVTEFSPDSKDAKSVEGEECSHASSEVTEPEPCDGEVQSHRPR